MAKVPDFTATKGQAYLHTRGLFRLATPVTVLGTYGPDKRRVRLRHWHRFSRVTYPAGTVRIVPVYALGAEPWDHTLVSIGGGKHIPKAAWLKRKAARRG